MGINFVSKQRALGGRDCAYATGNLAFRNYFFSYFILKKKDGKRKLSCILCAPIAYLIMNMRIIDERKTQLKLI